RAVATDHVLPATPPASARRAATLPTRPLCRPPCGSRGRALAEAGFAGAVGEERLERAIAQGAAVARRLGRLPKFADWVEARKKAVEPMLTEWEGYRLVRAGRGGRGCFPVPVRPPPPAGSA